jgi:hypothetical protein
MMAADNSGVAASSASAKKVSELAAKRPDVVFASREIVAIER